MANLSPDYFMKMFGMGGAGPTAGAKGAGSIFGNKEMLNKVAGMDLSKTIDPLKNTKNLSKLFGGLDSWVNRGSTMGGLKGLLGSLGGIGGKESKFDADLGTGKNPFKKDGEKPKWQNMKIDKIGDQAMGGLKDYRKKWMDHQSGKNKITDKEYLKNLQDIILYPDRHGFKV
jgi:hypothetical protein